MPTSSAKPITGGSTASQIARVSIGARGAFGGLSARTASALGKDAALRAAASGTADASSGEWKTAETMASPPQAALVRTVKPSAYLAGSLPSQTTPSISLLERRSLFGTLTFSCAAACL